jgi:hypothetical protein
MVRAWRELRVISARDAALAPRQAQPSAASRELSTRPRRATPVTSGRQQTHSVTEHHPLRRPAYPGRSSPSGPHDQVIIGKQSQRPEALMPLTGRPAEQSPRSQRPLALTDRSGKPGACRSGATAEHGLPEPGSRAQRSSRSAVSGSAASLLRQVTLSGRAIGRPGSPGQCWTRAGLSARSSGVFGSRFGSHVALTGFTAHLADHIVRDPTCGLEDLVYASAMAKRMVVPGSAGPSGHGDDASHMQKAPSTC